MNCAVACDGKRGRGSGQCFQVTVLTFACRWGRKRREEFPARSSASVQGAVLTLCIICPFFSLLRRTNSDSALHTSAMNPNPQNPFGMNQQMGRGPPQRNGKNKTQTQKCSSCHIHVRAACCLNSLQIFSKCGQTHTCSYLSSLKLR